MIWFARQTSRDKEPEIILGSLRCLAESDMVDGDGIINTAPLIAHMLMSVSYFLPSILTKKAMVSGVMIVLMDTQQ